MDSTPPHDGLYSGMKHIRNIGEGKMSSEPAKFDQEDSALEAAVDEAIAECDGDARAAVRALIVANTYLEEARNRAIEMVSRGYVRGRLVNAGAA